MDGFDEAEAQSGGDDGSEGVFGFLAAQGDTLEALELSEALLDAGAAAVERLREEGWPVPGVGLERDGRRNAPRSGERTGWPWRLALVGEHCPLVHVGPRIRQQFEQRALTIGRFGADGVSFAEARKRGMVASKIVMDDISPAHAKKFRRDRKAWLEEDRMPKACGRCTNPSSTATSSRPGKTGS